MDYLNSSLTYTLKKKKNHLKNESDFPALYAYENLNKKCISIIRYPKNV